MTTANTNSAGEASSNDDAFVEVILSRPSYRVGESVVGTIRLVPPTCRPAKAEEVESSNWPRLVFSDAYLFVAGWCRLDPRWHRAAEYAKQFESPAVHYNLHNRRSTNNGNLEVDEHCVCFWTTNVLHLMELKERKVGQWKDVKPKPIRGFNSVEEDKDSEERKFQDGNRRKASRTSADSNNSQASFRPLQEKQLSFTFRATLPDYLPHSMHGNSCRYFYAVMVGTRVKLPNSHRSWLRHACPLRVLSARPDTPLLSQQSRIPFPVGTCTAMAHSAGLPNHVTATQLHQPTGQILVNRRGNNSLGSLVMSSRSNYNQGAAAANNLQTMRITDLKGEPCCVLTAMGVSTSSPGNRMVLKFDFPIPNDIADEDDNDEGTPWTPCYQVSASLEGEEVALYVDGTKKRTMAYQFDTAHEYVDPDCTERVCLSLLVPLDAPTTMKSDIVEITIRCIIDITVGSGDRQNPQYSNLRLELPCRIVHSVSEYELVVSGLDENNSDDDLVHKLPLDELILGAYRTGAATLDPDAPPLIETPALRHTTDANHPSSFITKDIQQDLTILSLRMANDCQLVEE